MFSWICPQCGREVPPSKSECPDCAERAAQAAAQAQPVPQYQQPPQGPPQGWTAPPFAPPYPGAPQQPPYGAPIQPPPQQGWAPPQQQTWAQPPPGYAPPQQPPPQQAWNPNQPPGYPPPQQSYEPPPAPRLQPYTFPAPYTLPPQGSQPAMPHAQAPIPQAAWPEEPRQGLPTWLLTVIVAVILIGFGGGVYYYLGHSGAAGTAATEKPAGSAATAAAARQKVANPLQKYVEIVGLRMLTENKQPVARFLVVSHSAADITGLEANATIWASTSRSEEDSVGSFSFKLPKLGANDSKELTAPLKTKLKMYELPDWQNATAEIQITAPAAP